MKTILLIEDDAALRENTAELLELSNYNVITAPNGRLGIEKAKAEVPDIVVCDIMMPEVDGYEVLETLAADDQTRNIPFIFLSAKTEHKEIRKGMDMGADDYLTKPYEEDELISAIESRLAKAQLLGNLPSNGSATIKEQDIRSLHELKNHFDDFGSLTEYQKGEIIYSEDSHCNYVYLIAKGLVKTYKIDESGKELITGLYREDDFLGLTSFLESTTYGEYATALEPVSLSGVSKSELKNMLTDNGGVALELMEVLADNLSEVKEHLLQMAYSSVRKKTAQTILQFVQVLNRKPDEAIKISRNDLAAVAGIAPESLIRTLSGFKKEGLIEIEGRNIRILDLASLEAIE
jgi:CheY-like chemotaxis protein/CRP-like cAMP-binding protein